MRALPQFNELTNEDKLQIAELLLLLARRIPEWYDYHPEHEEKLGYEACAAEFYILTRLLHNIKNDLMNSVDDNYKQIYHLDEWLKRYYKGGK